MAARLKVNRSALFREALKAYLRLAREREREAADRSGYARKPESASELAAWDRMAAWPEK
jgi:metal-responsive CopG/Arc/MetJ family transcriptional regulator